LGAGPEVQVIQGDEFHFIRESHLKYDHIFAGPPYALESLPSLPDLIFEKGLVLDQGWFILEHNPNHDFSKHPHFLFLRRYGSTLFSIFVNQPEGYPV
jgi:16S rRNA (guanine966-N2)-methyltransferase